MGIPKAQAVGEGNHMGTRRNKGLGSWPSWEAACLYCKREDLGSNPTAHVEKLAAVVSWGCRQDSWSLLASQAEPDQQAPGQEHTLFQKDKVGLGRWLSESSVH